MFGEERMKLTRRKREQEKAFPSTHKQTPTQKPTKQQNETKKEDEEKIDKKSWDLVRIVSSDAIFDCFE